MSSFSPAGARCDLNPGDLFSLVTAIIVPKMVQALQIIREKIRIHEIFTLENACFAGQKADIY